MFSSHRGLAVVRLLLLSLAVMAAAAVANLEQTYSIKQLDETLVNCTKDEPCGQCQGNCGSDHHCAGDLICFQNVEGPSDRDDYVPSCRGIDETSANWCVVDIRAGNPTLIPNEEDEEDEEDEDAETRRMLTNRIPLIEPVVECSPTNQCGRCMGDCDKDSDCEGNLVCHQKDDHNTKPIPGCIGLDSNSATDWCVDPNFQDDPPSEGANEGSDNSQAGDGADSSRVHLVRPVTTCTSDHPCRRCEGDCDHDNECQGNLVCFQKDYGPRDDDKFIPGCLGVDSGSKTDWCVPPGWKEGDGVPESEQATNPPPSNNNPPPSNNNQGGGNYDNSPYILAYYYPWYYRNDWSRHGLQGNKPKLGYYGTDEPAIAEQHNVWAERAGIDAWVVSWWGRDHVSDAHFYKGMMAANNFDRIEFCMLYELGALVTVNFDDHRALDDFVTDMIYFRDNFFHRKNYLHVNGKPVVVLYLTRNYQNFKPWMVDEIQKRVGRDMFFIADTPYFGRNDKPESAVNGIVDGKPVFESYTSYNMFTHPAVRDGEQATEYMFREGLPIYERWAAQTTYFPQVLPMYHDFRGHPRLRGDDVQMRRQLEKFACLNKPKGNKYPNMMFMTSWNEWWEGSQLEPDEAGKYGFSFIDELRRFKDAGPANC